jgi:glyceraldehyde 3-phosphate dehydrogenase
MRNGKIRIGIMGLGQIGRHLYHLALENDDIEIVAVADIGKPEIIEYLLKSEIKDELQCQLRDNYLVTASFVRGCSSTCGRRKFRGMLWILIAWWTRPGDIVDARIWKATCAPGQKRVILASLPADPIDRIVIPGINEKHAKLSDRIISTGSATTNAFALLLEVLDSALGVDCASMTTVHATPAISRSRITP